MEKSVTSWDDIPSLELEMEDSSKKEEKPIEHRHHVRIDSNVLKDLLHKKADSIPIKISTQNGVFDGKIEDLSQRGVRVSVPNLLKKGEPVKLGFVINSYNILAKGIVIWVSENESGSTGGLKFVDPNQKDIDFIGSLTYASSFNKVGEVEASKKDHIKDFPE
ncbi:MAG: PilZ domain-containing protein [Proteobacteria bacterium]|nr:PilZ domain-containing protein [Pseudomonadota bacterium]MBU4035507.1 PilZ domain-containing protein [Pseudomonadota bacterium]